jgi:hypothetical protein
MAYNSKYKSQLLYEEKKGKEASEKLSKLQDGFMKFEKGILSSDKLIAYISKDLEIPVNEKIRRELKNPGFDYKSFRNLVKNLEFLNDNKTEYRQASNQIKSFTQSNKKEDLEREVYKKSMFIYNIFIHFIII